MMTLSCLKLDARDKNAQRDMRDAYQMHRTLSRAFTANLENDAAQKQALENARILFRVDEIAGLPIVLVQSRTTPDWSILKNGYCRESPQFKTIEPSLSEGSVWSFRLRANPTKCAIASDQKIGRGKRRGIYREEERLQWLHNKAEREGFRLLEVRVRDEGRPHRHRHDDGREYSLVQTQLQVKDNHATFSAALFEGALQVTDETKFSEALQNGIGRGKAFGFGLLSLRRA